MDQTWLLFEHKFVTLGLQILGGAFSPLVPYLEGIGVVVGGFLSHFSVVGISLSSRFFFFCFFLPRVDSGGVFHAFSEGLGGGFLESVWKQSEGHVERSWLRFEYLILILISFFFFSLYFGLHFLGW